jgi:hypothetical protein
MREAWRASVSSAGPYSRLGGTRLPRHPRGGQRADCNRWRRDRRPRQRVAFAQVRPCRHRIRGRGSPRRARTHGRRHAGRRARTGRHRVSGLHLVIAQEGCLKRRFADIRAFLPQPRIACAREPTAVAYDRGRRANVRRPDRGGVARRADRDSLVVSPARAAHEDGFKSAQAVASGIARYVDACAPKMQPAVAA